MYDSNWNMGSGASLNSWTNDKRFYKRYIWHQVKSAFDSKLENTGYHYRNDNPSLNDSRNENLKLEIIDGGLTWTESLHILNQVISSRMISACLNLTHSKFQSHMDLNSDSYIRSNAQFASNFLWRHLRINSHEPYTKIFYKMVAKKFPVIDLLNFEYKIDISYPDCEDKENMDYFDYPKFNRYTPKTTLMIAPTNLKVTERNDNSNIHLAKKGLVFTNNSFINSSEPDVTIDSSASDNSAQTQSFRSRDKKETKPITLIILIHTAPSNFKNRMSIRKSWGSLSNIKKKRNKATANPLHISTNDKYNKGVMNSIYKILTGDIDFDEMNIRLVFLTALTFIETKDRKKSFNMRISSPKPFPIRNNYPPLYNILHNSNATTHSSGIRVSQFNFSIYQSDQQSNRIIQRMLKIEARKYRDIVQGDFLDSYQNLTYKMIMGFKWIASRCSKADYVLKMDDDIYVDIFKLYLIINKVNHLKNLYDDYIQENTPIDTSDIIRLMKEVFVNSFSMMTKTDMINSVQKKDKEWVSDLLTSFMTPKFTRPLEKNSFKDETSLMTNQSSCKSIAAAYEALNTNPFTNILLCNVYIGMSVVRDPSSKWYVSEKDFGNKTFPSYCSGWAVLLPINAVYKLMYSAPKLPYFWIDDVHITGSLLAYSKLSLKRLNSYFTFGLFPIQNHQKISMDNKTNSEKSFRKQLSSNKYMFGYVGEDADYILKLWGQTLNFYMDHFLIT
ncbi:unnamed protein product [Gordionus sp. m RMFG-2023]